MKQIAFWREKKESLKCLKYSVTAFVEWIYKMQRLEVSGAVRLIYKSLGVKGLNSIHDARTHVYKKRKHGYWWIYKLRQIPVVFNDTGPILSEYMNYRYFYLFFVFVFQTTLSLLLTSCHYYFLF